MSEGFKSFAALDGNHHHYVQERNKELLELSRKIETASPPRREIILKRH